MEWIKQAQPVKAFALECLEFDLEAEIEKDAVYQVFCKYCMENNSPIPGKELFIKTLVNTLPSVKISRVRRGESRIHILKGVRLKQQTKLHYYT